MYSRGRSKDVSPVALARQASEERRRNSTSIMAHYPLPTDPEKCTLSPFFVPATSTSPSPAASPFTLTPPDPTPLPRTRIIHTDDSYAPIDPHKSPSTAQVINLEPFRHSVQPHLSLSLPSDPRREKPGFQMQSTQRTRDRARAKCRYETLARAEQVFATVIARSRRERLAVLVLRAHQEDELKERERVTREQERPERGRDLRRPTNCVSHAHRSGFRVLAHATPTPASQQGPATNRFTYSFPIASTTSSANSAPVRKQQGGIKSRLGLATLTNPKATNMRSVSFDDIRASMGGVLFPTAPGDSASSKTRRESELLGTLLEAVRWEEGERWQQKGRVKASALLPEIASECGACASASLPLDGLSLSSAQALSPPSGGFVSTSASTTSRPVSWLSFGSRKSTPSINTAQTTPLSAIKELPSFTDTTPQRSCGCVRGQSLMAVDVNDTPLGFAVEPAPTPVPHVASVNNHDGPSHRRSRKTSLSMRSWLASSVTSLLSTASRFQEVYVTATMATLASTDCSLHEQMLDVSSVGAPSKYSTRPPCGWRAQHNDVAKFTSGTLSANRDSVPYLIFHLVDLEGIPYTTPATTKSPINGRTQDSTPTSTAIPPVADRHIFNANRLHLLSRAQINSWRFRGAPGATPTRVYYRPELFYRLEPGGSSSRRVRGGSSLKWGWHVVWDTEGNVE